MARGLNKSGPQAIGRSRGGYTTKIHLVAAKAQCALSLALFPGQAGDVPLGRELLLADMRSIAASGIFGIARHFLTVSPVCGRRSAVERN